MYNAIKHRTFEILEQTRERDLTSQYFQIFIIILIVLNVVAVVLESVQVLLLQYYRFFLAFEIFSITIFSIEYLLRLWVCTESQEYHRPVIGRIRYALTPLAIVDLLAIVPFFLPFLIPVDLRFLRVLRIMRIFRALKLIRYSAASSFMARALRREKYVIFVSLLILAVLFVLASTLMYYAEYDAQPEAFASIPHAMWWAVVTLTTVGYGDIYPVTVQGKIIGAVVAILGIGFFALPAGIIAAGFISEVRNSGCREDTTPSDARLTSLERLAELKANGYLTEEEFLQEKQKILEER